MIEKIINEKIDGLIEKIINEKIVGLNEEIINEKLRPFEKTLEFKQLKNEFRYIDCYLNLTYPNGYLNTDYDWVVRFYE